MQLRFGMQPVITTRLIRRPMSSCRGTGSGAFTCDLKFCCFFFLLALLPFGLHAQSSFQPNVIFIVVDDLNDYVFEDGHPTSYAPNISRLAALGTRFVNTHCSSPLCAPSRNSFISGKDLAYTQIYDNLKINNWRDLFGPSTDNETVFTLPEVLKDSGGYYTYGINKIFHNFFRPEFDNDYDADNPDACNRGLSWSRFELYPEDPSVAPANDGIPEYGWGKIPNGQEPLLTDYRATSAAMQFLDDYESTPGSFCGRPFFLALGLVKPHTPHFVPERYFPDDFVDDIYAEPFDVPYNDPYNQYPPNGFVMPPQPEPIWSDYDDLESVARVMARENKPRHQAFADYAQDLTTLPLIDSMLTDSARRFILEQSKRANAVMGYWSAVRYLDAQVGRLIDHLESKPGLAQKTIIVIMSDHGYSLGEKTHWHKQALWETDTRIPLLIVDPGRSGDQVCRRTVSALDVFPTILELTGTSEPLFPDSSRYLDGLSLVALMDNPDLTWERPSLSTTRMTPLVSDGSCFAQFSVRSERFHYLRYQTNGTGAGCDPATSEIQEELYELGPELEVDPFEWNNLAANLSYKPIKDYLSSWLPGGDNYLGKNFALRITVEDVPCILSNDDTLRLHADVYDPDGNPIEPPPGTIVQFRVIPYNRNFAGPDATIVLSDVDSALFASLDELTFQAALYNSATGIIAFDSRAISINGSGAPTVNWNLVQEGPTVRIENYVEEGRIESSYWDFGDTYRSDDFWGSPFDDNFQSRPSSYTYTYPGDYEVVQHLFYGTNPDNYCEVSRTESLSIPDSLFEGEPCQTPGLVRMEVLNGDEALVRWAPVYADETYDLRYKRSRDFDVPWRQVSSNVPSAIIDSLEAGEEYSISVRGVCDTTRTSTHISDWSFPFRQLAVSCDHPTGIAVDSISASDALLSWDRVSNAEFYEVAWRKVGDPFTISPTGNRTGILLSGLEPATEYGIGVRTHCHQIFAQEPIGGEFSAPISIFTLGAPARQESPDKQTIPGIQVFPNPVSDRLEVTLSGTGFPDAVVDVFSMNGSLLLEAQPVGANPLSIDVSGWAAGTYVLRVSNGQAMTVRSFSIQ